LSKDALLMLFQESAPAPVLTQIDEGRSRTEVRATFVDLACGLLLMPPAGIPPRACAPLIIPVCCITTLTNVYRSLFCRADGDTRSRSRSLGDELDGRRSGADRSRKLSAGAVAHGWGGESSNVALPTPTLTVVGSAPPLRKLSPRPQPFVSPRPAPGEVEEQEEEEESESDSESGDDSTDEDSHSSSSSDDGLLRLANSGKKAPPPQQRGGHTSMQIGGSPRDGASSIWGAAEEDQSEWSSVQTKDELSAIRKARPPRPKPTAAQLAEAKAAAAAAEQMWGDDSDDGGQFYDETKGQQRVLRQSGGASGGKARGYNANKKVGYAKAKREQQRWS
jgi:hypothetical protein